MCCMKFLSEDADRPKEPGMSPMLPEPVARTRTSVNLPDDMLEALDEVAEESRATHPPNGLSRNDVIEYFLRWALKQHESETQGKKKR